MLYNYRKAILALALVSAASFGSAAMPPAPNYCEHMGYNYTYQENDSKSEGVCKFNENESCDAEAFLEGDCGKEQVKEIPCREEGDPVFTEFESCCNGLEPYLSPGAIGQSACQPEKNFLEKTSATLNFLFRMAGDMVFG